MIVKIKKDISVLISGKYAFTLRAGSVVAIPWPTGTHFTIAFREKGEPRMIIRKKVTAWESKYRIASLEGKKGLRIIKK